MSNDICEICLIKNTEYSPLQIEWIKKPCIEIWNKQITVTCRIINFYICKKCHDFIIQTCLKENNQLKKILVHEKEYRQKRNNKKIKLHCDEYLSEN